ELTRGGRPFREGRNARGGGSRGEPDGDYDGHSRGRRQQRGPSRSGPAPAEAGPATAAGKLRVDWRGLRFATGDAGEQITDLALSHRWALLGGWGLAPGFCPRVSALRTASRALAVWLLTVPGEQPRISED